MKRRTIHGELKAAVSALQRILDGHDKAARRFEAALARVAAPPRRSNGAKAAVSKR